MAEFVHRRKAAITLRTGKIQDFCRLIQQQSDWIAEAFLQSAGPCKVKDCLLRARLRIRQIVRNLPRG